MVEHSSAEALLCLQHPDPFAASKEPSYSALKNFGECARIRGLTPYLAASI